MKILYWCPYVGNIGTIKAVINSAKTFAHNKNNEIYVYRNINEWDGYFSVLKKNKIIIEDSNLSKLFFFFKNPTGILTRIYYLIVSLHAFIVLPSYLKRKNFDYIICNLCAIPILVLKIIFNLKVKIIISIQGYPKFLLKKNQGFFYDIENKVRKLLWRLLYNKAFKVVCLSENTKDELLKKGILSKSKIFVIPNPVIDDQIIQKSNIKIKDDWFNDSRCKKIISIGRLTKQKDYSTLIKAINLVKEKIKVKVLILGEGEDRSILEKKINKDSLGDVIKLYGYNENPYNYLKNSDIFVLTSLWEDPGHVILEAAYLKTPIISTACPSGPQDLLINGRAGDLCKIKDYKCISKAIISNIKRGPDLRKIELAYKKSLKYTDIKHHNELLKILKY